MASLEGDEWYLGADVGFAVVPRGREVDWSRGSFTPDQQVWVPEPVYFWLLKQLEVCGLALATAEELHLQTRFGADKCAQLLSAWERVIDAADRTPAQGWLVAVRLLLEQVSRNGEKFELLLEGP
jgi:hypothetical protein